MGRLLTYAFSRRPRWPGAAAKSPRTVPQATLAEMEPLLDTLISKSFQYFKFPLAVRAAYRARATRGRRSWCSAHNGAVAALNLLTGILDIGIIHGPALRRVLVLRVVVSAGYAAAALMMRYARPSRFDDLVNCLPPLLMLLCVGGAVMDSPSQQVFDHYLFMGMTVVAIGVVLLPIELPETIAVAGLSFLIMLGLILGRQTHAIAEQTQTASFVASALATLVYCRHVQNAREYRLFLLKQKQQIMLMQQATYNAALSSIAYTDPLTEIPNRRYYAELIQAIEVNPALYLPLSICMLDIDAFKNLNDKCGHGEGDRCLRQVAMTLRGLLRQKSDVVARYGGEEFVLIMPHTSAEGASEVAERMRLAVHALDYPNPDTPFGRVTISAGIAVAQEPYQVHSLIEAADLALYQAKAAGRNRTVVTSE